MALGAGLGAKLGLKALGGIFKKKEGGTVVGNALRNIASKATGGVLGQGLLNPTAPKGGVEAQTDAGHILRKAAEGGIEGATETKAFREATSAATKTGLALFWETHKKWIIPVAIVGTLGIIYLVMKKRR